MRGFCFQITFKILQLCYFLVYDSYITFQLNYSNVLIFSILSCSYIYTFQIYQNLPTFLLLPYKYPSVGVLWHI